jgi:transcriptional regulator with XRE-family HTH domain
MIKNDRQFRIVKARSDRLGRLAAELRAKADAKPEDKRLRFELRAVSGELTRMQEELSEYTSLKAGQTEVGEARTIGDIPRLLIRARIAAGLSQADLARRLGLKEQQIQRYESSDYEGASLGRLIEIGRALQVRLDGETEDATDADSLLRRLDSAGIDRRFVLRRILPGGDLTSRGDAVAALAIAARLGRVFGWDLTEMLQKHWTPGDIPTAAMAYKYPRSANMRRLGAYSTYARYLGELVLAATTRIKPTLDLSSAESLRETLLNRGGITFEGTVRLSWELGIPVLPLADGGGFHACYLQRKGRGVVVLKQLRRYESLWLFDLLHELGHALAARGETDLDLFEVSPDDSFMTASDEAAANEFASRVLFGTADRRLLDLVWTKSAGRPALLKRTVALVARKEGVDVGLLAYRVAHDARSRDIDWWATATAIQPQSGDPWLVCRDELVSRADLSQLQLLDHELLLQALSEVDDVNNEEVTDSASGI